MSKFDVKARQQERAFLNRTLSFVTAKGRTNKIVRVTETTVFIRTETGKQDLKVSRSRLRKAIKHMLYKRTTLRKQLEKFTQYSSAMFGLLMAIFVGKCKAVTTGLIRLTLVGARFFYAGCERSKRDLKVAFDNGLEFALMSYYYLRDEPAMLRHLREWGKKIRLDSGAFTLWKRQVEKKPYKEINVKDYADFIEQNRDLLLDWFNLDVIGDAERSADNAEYLRERGLDSIEVWHWNSPLEELDRLVAKNKDVVGIGGTVELKKDEIKRDIFRKVFDRHPDANFHWLGGGSSLAGEFPFVGFDSKSPTVGRMYSKIITDKGQIKTDRDPLDCLAHNVRYLVKFEESGLAWLAPSARSKQRN